MSKSGALATGVGGKIEKKEVLSAVEKNEKYHVPHGGDELKRKANYSDMQWKPESLRESIKRHEHFLALQLGLKQGQKVLDVGCSIGGPLREISRFRGINNNEYQITRGTELNRIVGVDNNCSYVKADFMNMPFSENSFDAIFAIEATCHAPDVVCWQKQQPRERVREKEKKKKMLQSKNFWVLTVLKHGQCFAAYEWCITDSFDPNNEEHQRIKGEVELGNGLPDIRSMKQCLEALKLPGFEVIWKKDVASDSSLPWYLPLDKCHFSPSNFRVTAAGRFITRNMVKALEFVGLAPEGSQRVQAFLEKTADALIEGGRWAALSEEMNSVQEQTKQNKKRRSEEMNLWKQHFGEDVNRSEFCVEEQRGSRRVTEQRQCYFHSFLGKIYLGKPKKQL
ncbi:unnamed protein product [Camellia sinensis]